MYDFINSDEKKNPRRFNLVLAVGYSCFLFMESLNDCFQ